MASLKKKSTIAIIWDLLGRFSTQGVSFIVLIFLARLLSPEEFGIVGIALAVIGFTRLFVEVGFEVSLIQNKTNSQESYSSIFFLNLGLSIFLFLVFQLVAEQVALFFQEPRLTAIIKWLSVGLIFQALITVQTAILKRNLKFKALSLRLLIAGIISGSISIYLAFQGYGVYALVVQNIIASLVSAIVLWSVSQWRPSFFFSWKSITHLLSFNGYQFLSNLGHQIIVKVNVLFIGKFFSPTTLSFFTQADSLSKLIIGYSSESINNVFFPILSQVQDNLSQFRRLFLKLLRFTSFLTFLLAGIMLLSGKMLILSLLGAKWLPCVFIFQILMLRSINTPTNAIILHSFLALGKAREDFWYGNIRKLLSLLPLSFAFFYGFDSFLYSLVIVTFIGSIFNNIISSYTFKISFKILMFTIYKFALIFLISLMIIWLIPPISNHLIINSLFNVFLFTGFYLFGSLNIDAEILEEIKQLYQKGINSLQQFFFNHC